MSVHKDYWGQGIGILLLDSLLKWANDNSAVTKIHLSVRTDNHRAIDLYQRKGFVVEGTIRNDFFLDGTYYDHHLMGLDLANTELRRLQDNV